VTLISKYDLCESNTLYAQGGISAVWDKQDSVQAHISDTLEAGAGLCHESVVHFTAERGPQAIRWLLDMGMEFTHEQQADGSKNLHLTREGGHSHRRVAHAADATGRALESALVTQAIANPNIAILEHHMAIDLILSDPHPKQPTRCLGAYLLDILNQQVMTCSAKVVVLATGGASKTYLYTSNPDVSTGDGIAMAWRAGCSVANMEFIQFHPTCLYHPKARSFLITEALRGEGAYLTLPDGNRFMPQFDSRAELAPRDIVARAIDHEMKRLGIECVFLDISHRPSDFIIQHFPTIYRRCLEMDIDITQQPIPVVPAAHYTCGGIVTDLHARTDLEGLYAVGEAACTGLHGANRMASNSLLECLVFGASAAQHIQQQLEQITSPNELPDWDETRVTQSNEEVVVTHNWDEIRHFMWDYVGIVRSNTRLERAKKRIDLLQNEISEYYQHFKITSDLLELRNLAQVAELIIHCAMTRKESRGLHYTLDYPHTDTNTPPADSVLTPNNFPKKSI
jgi:L-aspartate oxidase